MEVWKKVPGFNDKYEVSNTGNVRNEKGHLLRPFLTHQGYLMVTLCENGKRKQIRLNRLVAEAFIANPDNKPEVNHKNGIKTDNAATNLEWATKSENMIHAYKSGLQKKGKHHIRKVVCLNDGKTYFSIGEAARAYDMNRNAVSACCRRKSTRGSKIFRYVEVDNG